MGNGGGEEGTNAALDVKNGPDNLKVLIWRLFVRLLVVGGGSPLRQPSLVFLMPPLGAYNDGRGGVYSVFLLLIRY